MADAVPPPGGTRNEFEAFVAEHEPRLRRALVATYGPERGREAAAEALAYAWQHWQEVSTMANPAGYLYRVGQSRTRPRKTPALFAPRPDGDPAWVEPELLAGLGALTEPQRTAVVLVHAYGWTHPEVAELTGVSASSVQTHLDRGLVKLRRTLGVDLPVATRDRPVSTRDLPVVTRDQPVAAPDRPVAAPDGELEP